jgi:hypothetical protein
MTFCWKRLSHYPSKKGSVPHIDIFAFQRSKLSRAMTHFLKRRASAGHKISPQFSIEPTTSGLKGFEVRHEVDFLEWMIERLRHPDPAFKPMIPKFLDIQALNI